MAKRIATLIGWTLIALAVVMAVAVPVWLSGEGTIYDLCKSPGTVGAFLEENSRLDVRYERCRSAAAARLYHVAPFVIIGIGCLFFPKPKDQATIND
jgi:hypothetical protein